jgi:hypothetical protein
MALSNVFVARNDGSKKPPLIVCPKCKRENLVMMTEFEKDISKIVADKCLGCGCILYVGCMLIGHVDIRSLAAAIQEVIAAIRLQESPILKS